MPVMFLVDGSGLCKIEGSSGFFAVGTAECVEEAGPHGPFL